MLDPRITQHVEMAMRVKANEFDRSVRMRMATIDRESSAAGQFGSSRRVLRHGQAIGEELERRALSVFDEIKRALQLHRPQLDDALPNWLAGLHITETRKQCTELQRLISERFDRPAAQAFGPSSAPRLQNSLNEQCDRLRDKYTFEIGNAIQELRQAVAVTPAQGGPSIVVHGNIGAVQTGANASATVTMHIGDADRAVLLAAIEQLGAALQSAQYVACKRQDLLEILEQVKIAAQESSPKPALLRSLLNGFANGTQTIAAIGPAWELVRGAVQSMGIELPAMP